MKIKSLYILLILFMVSSCSEDFTDLAPISQRNVGNFYQTPGDMEVATNAIYSVLQKDGCYNESYWVMFEMRSDNSFWDGTGLARIFAVVDQFTEFADNELLLRAYNDNYQGVALANIVLSRIDDIEFDDNALKERLRGEALFLRSLFYYHLAVGFGNIPLVLEETRSVSEGAEHVQVPASQVYAQLITDLAEAESRLEVSYPSSEVGRATKGAAATLLAKVLLTTGDKSGAETVLRRIISSYGYELVDDYNDLWGVENEHNVESIFEVEFQGGLGTEGNRYTNDFSSPLPTSVSGFRNFPEPDLINAYEDGDTRFAATLENDPESPTTWWTVKYGRENPFIEGDAPNNWVVFRYADVLLMLAEAIGEGEEAYGLINQIRNRAGLDDIDASTPGTFEEKLLNERRLELAYENHRWPDLLRFGVAEQYMSQNNRNVNGRLLFAIPQRELDLNPNFVQNPGYN
jgi:hypothetical protein